MWNDVTILEKIARFTPYTFIVVGFIVALSGQFVSSSINSRIKTIKAQVEYEFKRTPPQVEVSLAKSATSGNLLVVIDTNNLVPIKTRWTIVTKKNQVVTGIMLECVEIHPTDKSKRFTSKADINEKKVVDEFIELRFQYESVYFAEVGVQDNLKGSINRQYRLYSGEVYDWKIEKK